MKHTIAIPLLPPTLNEIIKIAKENPHRYARLKKSYTRDCALAALGSPAFPDKVWLSFKWKVKTLRRDPADNTPAAAKFILDGFVDAGILSDDSGFIIQPPVVHFWVLSRVEGVEVTISDRPLFKLIPLEQEQTHVALR